MRRSFGFDVGEGERRVEYQVYLPDSEVVGNAGVTLKAPAAGALTPEVVRVVDALSRLVEACLDSHSHAVTTRLADALVLRCQASPNGVGYVTVGYWSWDARWALECAMEDVNAGLK